MKTPMQTPLTAYQVDKSIVPLLCLGYNWELGPDQPIYARELTHEDFPGIILPPIRGLHDVLIAIYEQARALPEKIDEKTHDMEEGEPCDFTPSDKMIPDEMTDGEPLETQRHTDFNNILIG